MDPCPLSLHLPIAPCPLSQLSPALHPVCCAGRSGLRPAQLPSGAVSRGAAAIRARPQRLPAEPVVRRCLRCFVWHTRAGGGCQRSGGALRIRSAKKECRPSLRAATLRTKHRLAALRTRPGRQQPACAHRPVLPPPAPTRSALGEDWLRRKKPRPPRQHNPGRSPEHMRRMRVRLGSCMPS